MERAMGIEIIATWFFKDIGKNFPPPNNGPP
jgi:hypothetical protein